MPPVLSVYKMQVFNDFRLLAFSLLFGILAIGCEEAQEEREAKNPATEDQVFIATERLEIYRDTDSCAGDSSYKWLLNEVDDYPARLELFELSDDGAGWMQLTITRQFRRVFELALECGAGGFRELMKVAPDGSLTQFYAVCGMSIVDERGFLEVVEGLSERKVRFHGFLPEIGSSCGVGRYVDGGGLVEAIDKLDIKSNYFEWLDEVYGKSRGR